MARRPARAAGGAARAGGTKTQAELRVCGPGGPLCVLAAQFPLKVHAAKKLIAHAASVPVGEQQLLRGLHMLEAHETLTADTGDITLIRRDPDELARAEMRSAGAFILARAQKLVRPPVGPQKAEEEGPGFNGPARDPVP